MMIGAAILTGASFIMALAPNWQTLVFARAADGIAIGIIAMTHSNIFNLVHAMFAFCLTQVTILLNL